MSEANNEMIADLKGKYFVLESKMKKYIDDVDSLNMNVRQLTIEKNQALEKHRTIEVEIGKRENDLREYRRIITVNEQSISQLNRTILELQSRNNEFVQF